MRVNTDILKTVSTISQYGKDKSSIKSKLPECEPITCSKPKPPENGGVSATGIKHGKQ